jgi:hypothetical protein
MFIGMGVDGAIVLHDPAFRLNRVIIRAVYLAVAAALLGYLAAHKRQVDSNMSKLAAWPRGTFRELVALAQNELVYAADLLHAPRVLMFWEEPEEPWIHLAVWSHNTFHLSRESPDTFDRLVAKPLIDASFLSPDARVPVPRVLYTSSAGMLSWEACRSTPMCRRGLPSALSSPRACAEPPLKGASYSSTCDA